VGAVAAALREAGEGAGRVVVVAGEAGIGTAIGLVRSFTRSV